MLITNNTNVDYWLGPIRLPANATGFSFDDTTETSLYLLDDNIADMVNTLSLSGMITCSSTNSPFPRPTGVPTVLHGNGSPNGLIYAPQGSLYLRRDNSNALDGLYTKASGIESNVGWLTPSAPTRVTTLPTATAVDLQQVIYDPGLQNIEWLCTFNASSGYWSVAGPPLHIGTGNTVAANSSWQQIEHVNVPNAGDYQVTFAGGVMLAASTDETGNGVSIAGGNPVNGLTQSATTGGNNAIAGMTELLTGFTAGQAASLMVNNFSAAAGTFEQCTGFAQPVRIT